MSYMNLLETNARFSVAISILNSFRHWLSEREEANFSDEDRKIFLESVDIKQTKALSPKMILYSFQGFSDSEHSAAIELSEALSNALEITFKDEDPKSYLELLKSILDSNDVHSVSDEEKASIMKLITNTMQVISSQTEQKTKSAFTWKSL